MYETILVPTDGSDVVDRTLPHAVRLATDHGAQIHALYVVDQRIVRANSGDLGSEVRENLETEGENAVEAVERQVSEAGIDAETAVREGTPDKEIVEYAEAIDADVVVIGPQGKSAREKVRGLGSVSDRVAADAEASVFLVKDRP